MKRNTFYIDNRAEWKMKKIVCENDISSKQFSNILQFAKGYPSKGKPKIIKLIYSTLHSLSFL